MPFRFGKYFAFGGFLFAYQWSAQWYLKELKNVQIYDYMTKRARLYDHIQKTRKLWKYGQERHQQMVLQVQEEEDMSAMKQ